MPIAKFEMPDGRIARFEVPEGTTPEQAQAMIQQQVEQNPGMFGGGQPEPPAQPQQQQQEDGFLKNVADVGLEGMAAVNRGATQLADFFTTDQFNAWSEVLGSDRRVPSITESLSSATAGNFMEDGLAKDVVRTGGELVAPGMAAGQVFRAGAQALPKMGRASEGVRAGALRQMGASTPAQEAGYSAISGAGSELGGSAGESVGGQTGRQVGELAGGILAPIAATGAPSAELVRRGFRGGEQGRKTLAKAVEDFAEIGSTPTVGQGTGDGLRRGVETLSGRILGGGPIRKAINRTSDNMQSRLREIADDMSTVRGNVEAGRVVQKGITGDDGFVKRFTNKSSQLWRGVDEKIGSNAQSDIENTKETLNQLVRSDGFSKMLNNPVLTGLKESIESTLGKTRIRPSTQTRETVTTIPYKDLRVLRTTVGEKLGSQDLISDVPRQQLKRLYAALSEDTREVARKAGALDSFTRANNYTRSGHKRIDDFVDRVASKVDLDKVYSQIAKGGDGTQSLNAMKRSLKPDEWEAVVSNVVRNMGKATPGQQDATGDAFSVNRFLTDWNRLGESRKVLFSGTKKLNEYGDNLDRIARSAERFRESAQEMANPSGTGQFVANVGILSSGGAALGTGNLPTFGLVVSGVAANNGASRLMTNPRFVKWLEKGTEVDDWPAHIVALNNIAREQGLEPEISELLDTMKVESPETGQAPENQGRRERTSQ